MVIVLTLWCFDLCFATNLTAIFPFIARATIQQYTARRMFPQHSLTTGTPPLTDEILE